jgi:dTMP kinase
VVTSFIVLEGGEGAGKSTLQIALVERLRAAGHEAVSTREPGGTEAGELIRTLLRQKLTPWAETFAFLAARAQVVAEVIRPALDRGAFVVCDRFSASTFAYQGYARGLDLATIRAANAAATGGLEPGLTLFLDLDPAIGLRRKHGEQDAIHVGNESIEFHQKVREGYRALMAEAAPASWLRIDASLSAEEVAALAWGAVEARVLR